MKVARRFMIAAFSLASTIVHADDGAASIAAGGIVMVREPRITMQKEVLRISDNKVRVDYEFRNDTGINITTEVAFPILPYRLNYEENSLRIQGFEDFKLTVNGNATNFQVEAKAKFRGRDISPMLRSFGIDIETFGQVSDKTGRSKDIEKLSAGDRETLTRQGIVGEGPEGDEGRWTVEKRYYWLQTFPAHAIVVISHEYTPALGSLNTAAVGLLETDELHSIYAKELKSMCIDPALRKILIGHASNPKELVPYNYVDFILTTANTWKGPIEDFTLIVDRPHHKYAKQTLVSFCWDGPVTKSDADHFSAHIANLVPSKELRIGFIDVEDYPQE